MDTTYKYSLPPFLENRCTRDAYWRWLDRKATAHYRRDRKRGNTGATREAYMLAIHNAILNGGEFDAYTGQKLNWELISTYNNEDSKKGKRFYKKSLGDLPTVDHTGDGLDAPEFKICAWRTNDCKSDLTFDEFVNLCRQVVEQHERNR
jgi:hypothetical protein